MAATKAEITSDVENGGEEGGLNIMSAECQDPILAKSYLGLPVLP